MTTRNIISSTGQLMLQNYARLLGSNGCGTKLRWSIKNVRHQWRCTGSHKWVPHPLALYVNCGSHCLNLPVSALTEIVPIAHCLSDGKNYQSSARLSKHCHKAGPKQWEDSYTKDKWHSMGWETRSSADFPHPLFHSYSDLRRDQSLARWSCCFGMHFLPVSSFRSVF